MTSGYAYGQDEPVEHCPYCNTVCRADFVDVGVTSARATFERACRRLFELGGPSPENMAWCENRAREIQVEIAARRARVAAAPDVVEPVPDAFG